MMSRRSMVAGSLGTIFAGTAVAIPASTHGQVYPGTRVNGTDISGCSVASTEARLRTLLEPLEQHAITYTFENSEWAASLADLGMSIDYEAMLQQAMAHGRDGSLFDRYSSWLIEHSERDIPLALRHSPEVLRSYLGNIGQLIAIEARDAHLTMQEADIVVVDHVEGLRLDLEQAISDTLRSVQTGEAATIALPTLPEKPSVTTADLHSAADRARHLLSGPVRFTHDGQVYPIDVETLTSALTIDPDNTARLDHERLSPRLDAITSAVVVPARNVKLGWDNGLFVVENDVDGMRVDRDALEASVHDLACSAERTAPLPLAPIKAEARADNIDELGIEQHIAYGSSSFVGSSAARATNVAVSARNISYKLVAPGETFSFNDLLGPITEENGFVEGTIIQGDWAASDLGGGVCQVSTTVFRAAANAGFRFTEWHPHSWRLDFYEADGSPPGLDAAIYQNPEWELDLVFPNPLESWLLLTMAIDSDTVTAHLYGKHKGWSVELGDPRLSAPKPIPEPIERINPNLPSGERIKVQEPRAGVAVSIRRTVTATDGSIVSDSDFVSDYRSVPEAWEVGSA
jgi:vancomycin resistance protein YoaR